MSPANKKVLELSRCVWEDLRQEDRQDLERRYTVKIVTYSDEAKEGK